MPPRRRSSVSLFHSLVDREAQQSLDQRLKRDAFHTSNLKLKASIEVSVPQDEGNGLSGGGGGEIVEILALDSPSRLVFALSQSGVCTVLKRCEGGVGLAHHGTLNTPLPHGEEEIRSMFHNKRHHSMVVVFVRSDDTHKALHCRSIPLRCIEQKDWSLSDTRSLFESETFVYPSFIEFDDVNDCVLTFSANRRCFKVWSLMDYRLLLTIDDPLVTEMKLSPGLALMIYERDTSAIQLRLLNVRSGKLMRCFFLPLHHDKDIEFIELFNEKLLLKQEEHSLRIFDVITEKVTRVDRSRFRTPEAFIFLYDQRTLLTFRDGRAETWSFDGDTLLRCENRAVCYSNDCQQGGVCVSSNQKALVSYSRDETCDQGSIDVVMLRRGRVTKTASARLPVAAQFEEPPATLFYDETRHEVIGGFESGLLCVFSR